MQEQGKTIIVVSHDPFFEAIADNVIAVSYTHLDFVITYNVNGNMSVRGTEIFYKEYKQQWQDEIENIW